MHRKQPEWGSPHLCALTKEGQGHIGQCHDFPEAQMRETRASKEEGIIHCSVHPAHLQTTTWRALPHSVYEGQIQYPNCAATLSEHTDCSCKPLPFKVEWKLSWEQLCCCEIICAWLTDGGLKAPELRGQHLCASPSDPADWRWESRATKSDIIPKGAENALCYSVGLGWDGQIITLIKIVWYKIRNGFWVRL